MSNTNPQVDEWFQELDHPLKEEMRHARQIFLEAAERMSESIKWSAPTFEFMGNSASFQPRAKKFASLMFHRGSEIPGDHPDLEGDAPLVRIMRFQDVNVRPIRGQLCSMEIRIETGRLTLRTVTYDDLEEVARMWDFENGEIRLADANTTTVFRSYGG